MVFGWRSKIAAVACRELIVSRARVLSPVLEALKSFLPRWAKRCLRGAGILKSAAFFSLITRALRCPVSQVAKEQNVPLRLSRLHNPCCVVGISGMLPSGGPS
jgi:hypothetical protein